MEESLLYDDEVLVEKNMWDIEFSRSCLEYISYRGFSSTVRPPICPIPVGGQFQRVLLISTATFGN